VAVWSKVQVCGSWIAGIAGSDPAKEIYHLLLLGAIVKQRKATVNFMFFLSVRMEHLGPH